MKETTATVEERRKYTRNIFSVVAPVYPLVTRLLSFGRDRAWKRTLCAALPQECSGAVLDLACGTGDIAFACKKKFPAALVMGVDSSKDMLLSARKNMPFPVTFLQQDLCGLGVSSLSVDIVTGGYALRNAPDLKAAIREIDRVLIPGGTAAFLDFSKSTDRTAAQVHNLLLRWWGSLWGIFLHGNPRIYRYIADSLERFSDRSELRSLFMERGFSETASWRRMFGMVEIVIFKKAG